MNHIYFDIFLRYDIIKAYENKLHFYVLDGKTK